MSESDERQYLALKCDTPEAVRLFENAYLESEQAKAYECLKDKAHLTVNVCSRYYSSERTVRINLKKWWQWWG